jgi:hypothetical protein
MGKLSTVITKLFKKLTDLRSVHKTFAAKVARKVETLLKPAMPAQKEAPSVESFLDSMGFFVEYQAERVRVADEKVFQEKTEDREAFLHQEETLENTRQGTIALKKSVEGLHGSEALEQIGLDGETPSDPVGLYRLLQAAANKLKKEGTLPPALVPDGPAWSADDLLQRLEKLWLSLEGAVEAQKQERRETQEAQIERRAAMRQLRLGLNVYSALLENLARLTGDDEIADRVRPLGGRPRKQPDSPQDEPDPTPDNPS